MNIFLTLVLVSLLKRREDKFRRNYFSINSYQSLFLCELKIIIFFSTSPTVVLYSWKGVSNLEAMDHFFSSVWNIKYYYTVFLWKSGLVEGVNRKNFNLMRDWLISLKMIQKAKSIILIFSSRLKREFLKTLAIVKT